MPSSAFNNLVRTALGLCLTFVPTGIGRAADLLSVTGYELVSSRPFAPGLVEETYRPIFTHAGGAGSPDAIAVRAIAWSRAPGLQLVDAFVRPGSVAAGTSVASADTVTLRRAAHVVFDRSQLGWTMRWVGDRLVDATWAGTWSVTAKYFDAVSGALLHQTTANVPVTRADGLGFSLLPAGVACRGTSDAFAAAFQCRIDLAGLCRVKGEINMALTRDAETLTGTGVWNARPDGLCPEGADALGQRMEIAATRLDVSVPAQGMGTLLGAVLDLPLPLKDLARETAVPSTSAECTSGGFSRYTFPGFASEAQCAEFVARQNGGAR